mmetsp:Transcript_28636/g.92186  ORF Transcript_28636/g.92186 Transcript_28636/m.92186 type:complete len:233 (+) Transcript_28636:401-1099(+)
MPRDAVSFVGEPRRRFRAARAVVRLWERPGGGEAKEAGRLAIGVGEAEEEGASFQRVSGIGEPRASHGRRDVHRSEVRREEPRLNVHGRKAAIIRDVAGGPPHLALEVADPRREARRGSRRGRSCLVSSSRKRRVRAAQDVLAHHELRVGQLHGVPQDEDEPGPGVPPQELSRHGVEDALFVAPAQHGAHRHVLRAVSHEARPAVLRDVDEDVQQVLRRIQHAGVGHAVPPR